MESKCNGRRICPPHPFQFKLCESKRLGMQVRLDELKKQTAWTLQENASSLETIDFQSILQSNTSDYATFVIEEKKVREMKISCTFACYQDSEKCKTITFSTPVFNNAGKPMLEAKDTNAVTAKMEYLHNNLLQELSQLISPSINPGEFERVKCMCRMCLKRAQIAASSSFLDICDQLETNGDMRVGDYTQLKKILENINAPSIQKIMKVEDKINQLRSDNL